jgi:hypothetical protein
MTLCKDIRDYIISKNPYFVDWKKDGGFLAADLLPESGDVAEGYAIAIIPEPGDPPPAAPKTMFFPGFYILIRARAEQIDQQEIDAKELRRILHMTGYFVINGTQYVNVKAKSSWFQAGWVQEDRTIVRYTTHHYQVQTDE